MSYQTAATEARKKILSMIHKAHTSHIGSNFSVIEILSVIFSQLKKDDNIILSAGWKAAAFYYFLVQKGILQQEAIDTFCREGSKFIGLTEPMPGILFAGGSMGMGLPAGIGFALAKKIRKEPGTVYVIMSDGEMQCGMTWESALIAKKYKLDNLTVIVDNNKFCATGKTGDVLTIEPLLSKWKSFGWNTVGVFDGHNTTELEIAVMLKNINNVPKVIVANTIKGKGVSFMEDQNIFHYKAPNKEEYELALKELNV